MWLSQLLALEGLSFKDLTQAIIATVVPAVLFDLRALCRGYLKCEPMIVGDPALDLGLKANVDRPQSVGADRLCNTVAAHERYPGAVIVVDFGTATNFDIVAENGDFDGSVIAPGANLSIEALHQAAALLPRVAIHRAQKVIGRDTVPSMQSGGVLGLCRADRGADKPHPGRVWPPHDGGGDRRAGASLSPRHSGHRAYRPGPHHARPDADPRPQRAQLNGEVGQPAG